MLREIHPFVMIILITYGKKHKSYNFQIRIFSSLLLHSPSSYKILQFTLLQDVFSLSSSFYVTDQVSQLYKIAGKTLSSVF